MYDSLIHGLVMVLHWPAIGYLVAGVVMGLWLGAIPGLSGLTGLAVLLPFTFGMPPVEAFSLLLGMFAVTTTGDTITAILIGVPGTSAAAATILDGYPMARNGEAARAFGASFTCSAIGGVLGAAILGLSLPLLKPLIMSFASPEYFMLGVLGITMVGTLSGDSIAKGLAAACLGVLVSTIGFSPQGAVSRYDFGITYLMNQGLPIVPVVLGLFAIPETVSLTMSGTSIADVKPEQVHSGLVTGIVDSFREWWLVLRCTLIGVYIGILPGMGGSVVDWVAYGHAVQSSKDKSRFGKGDVRGVIAPQAAENAIKGGALIPTVAFGIPGSTGMALLLSAFLIQGLTPGPQMLTTKLDITFSLMWTLVIANIIGAGAMMIWTKQLSKVTFIPGDLIVPAVVLFVFMGAWMADADMGDWYLALVFGAIGLAMRYGGWPRAPMILGFILGSIMETALNISMQSYGFEWIYGRPVTAVIGALAVLTVVLTLLGIRKRRRDPNRVILRAEIVGSETEEKVQKYVSLPLAIVFVAILGVAIVKAWDWPYNVGLFPLTFAYPALGLVLLVLISEIVSMRRAVDGVRPPGIMVQYAGVVRGAKALQSVLGMCGWFAAIIIMTYIAGQLIALPLFIAGYLLARGYRWYVAAIYAGCGWAMLYGVFGLVANVAWYPSLILGV